MNITQIKEKVETHVQEQHPSCCLIAGAPEEFEKCFVFYYQSKKYVETGDVEEMYVGQGPLIISKTNGEIFETGSAYSTEHYVNAFEKSGDPFGEPTSTILIDGYEDGASSVKAIKYIKNTSGSGLSSVKKVIDTVLNGEPATIDLGDIETVEGAISELKVLGFSAVQVWSTQC